MLRPVDLKRNQIQIYAFCYLGPISWKRKFVFSKMETENASKFLILKCPLI